MLTIPCFQSFCSKCLQRALDHNDTCPLCREKLPGYVYFQDHSCNKLVLSISKFNFLSHLVWLHSCSWHAAVLQAFPEAYAERGEMVQAEERDARLDTPIFVCQLSFPGMPTILHLFEPRYAAFIPCSPSCILNSPHCRYRLMLRRCLETPHPCFGMIPPPRPSSTSSTSPGPGNDYGTMLEIRNVQMLPDGRSVVETWGSYRFRIMERGVLDGYVVGRVERVEDLEEVDVEVREDMHEEVGEVSVVDLASPVVPSVGKEAGTSRGGVAAVPAPKRAGTSNEELMAICRDFVEELKDGTPWVGQHLNTNYVPMPDDPAEFSFWMAPVSHESLCNRRGYLC